MANPEHIELFKKGKDEWNKNPPVDADFSGHVFEEKADFSGFVFNDAEFNSATFKETVFFIGAEFKGIANFKHSTFKNTAFFEMAKFNKLIELENSKFFDYLYFINTEFKEYSHFYECRFSKLIMDNASFGFATSFRKSEFTICPKFHNTKLHQDTDFTGTIFNDVTSDGAVSSYRTLKLVH